MSEYFRVLNRLQADHDAPSLVPLQQPIDAPASQAREGKSRPAGNGTVVPLFRTPSAIPDEPPAAESSFLEPLIDIVEQNRVKDGQRCLVLTSASDGGATEALALHAVGIMHSRGVPVDCVRLADAAGPRATSAAGSLDAELSLNLRQADWVSHLQDWRASLPHDGVALMFAPSLATSADAARVACVCDGLLILVELGHTSRADLKLAVKRARAVGCAVLGLVVVGSSGLPEWARRLMRR